MDGLEEEEEEGCRLLLFFLDLERSLERLRSEKPSKSLVMLEFMSEERTRALASEGSRTKRALWSWSVTAVGAEEWRAVSSGALPWIEAVGKPELASLESLRILVSGVRVKPGLEFS